MTVKAARLTRLTRLDNPTLLFQNPFAPEVRHEAVFSPLEIKVSADRDRV
jgi:hypothetical protein